MVVNYLENIPCLKATVQLRLIGNHRDGCSLKHSGTALNRSRLVLASLFNGCTSANPGFPAVRVSVLSKTIVSTLVSASIVAPFFNCKASLLFVVFLAYAVWLLIVQLHIHLLGSDFGLAA
jgi:hypothetical protein